MLQRTFLCAVPLALQDSVPTQVTVAVDRSGFFLYYTDQEEVFTLDMALIRYW